MNQFSIGSCLNISAIFRLALYQSKNAFSNYF